jgi:hypothetical protein
VTMQFDLWIQRRRIVFASDTKAQSLDKVLTQSCRTTLSSELWTCNPPSKPPL